MISNATRKWRDNAGVLAVAGALTYATAFIMASAAYIIIAPINRTIAGSVGTTILILTYLIMGVAITKSVANGKRASIEQMLIEIKKTWVDIGIAMVFAGVPMLLGLLGIMAAAAYSISSHNQAISGLGLGLITAGYLASTLLSLAPYIAARKGWEQAIKDAHRAGRQKYITLLTLGIVFTIFYIIYIASLPTILGPILAVIDAAMIMPIRNIIYYEVLDSVPAHE